MALDLSNARMTFNDDFNSFSHNTNSANSINWNATPNGTWATRFWWGDGMRVHGNGEQQFYADSTTDVVKNNPGANPISVANGELTIKAQPSPDLGASWGKPYVSGLITTEGTFSQQYGYFEMRADLPTGQGIWPAFWMLNQAHTWPPELDIVEMIGSRPNMLEMTAHTGIGGHSTAGMNHGVDVGDMTTGMHTYGVKVMPDTMTWYFDGQEMFTASTPDDLKQPLYMLANVAVGGDWPGSPDGSTPWPAEMKIDYIRAYQFPDLPGYDGGTTSPAPAPGTAAPAPAPAPATPQSTPVTATIGSGADSLMLKVSQDAYQGDAQYTVSVDGQQVGGTQTAGAAHGSGQADTLTVRGDWAAGSHDVTVNFLNDAYGGSAGADRNLYVESATYNDANVAGAARTLWSAGPSRFSVTDGGGGAAPSGSASQPITAGGGEGPDAVILKVSQTAYQGDAQYVVKVDGYQIGGVFTAHADHASGQSDTIELRGNFGSRPQSVEVQFLNDHFVLGGGDRNLFVDGVGFQDDGAGSVALPGSLSLWSQGAGLLTFA